MYFRASYDNVTKIVSSLVSLAVLVVVVFVHIVVLDALLLLIPILTYAYSPRGYSVANGIITVKRLAGKVNEPIGELREARRTRKEDKEGGIRLLASGGLFGYYGLFRTTILGKCTWYVTNRNSTVVIVTAARTTLYSPDDVDGFLEAVRRPI